MSHVFASSENGLDLMLCGSLRLVKESGESTVTPFASRLQLDKSSVNHGRARLSFVRVYVVREASPFLHFVVAFLFYSVHKCFIPDRGG